jgi:hypothetical protein
MELIIAQFVFCVKKDEHVNGKADTEARDLCNRKSLIPPQVPESGFEIILDHGYTLGVQ